MPMAPTLRAQCEAARSCAASGIGPGQQTRSDCRWSARHSQAGTSAAALTSFTHNCRSQCRRDCTRMGRPCAAWRSALTAEKYRSSKAELLHPGSGTRGCSLIRSQSGNAIRHAIAGSKLRQRMQSLACTTMPRSPGSKQNSAKRALGAQCSRQHNIYTHNQQK